MAEGSAEPDEEVGILMELSDMLSEQANKLAIKRSRYSQVSVSRSTGSKSPTEEGLLSKIVNL